MKDKWLYWSHRIGLFMVIGLIIDFLWHYFRPIHPELITQLYEVCYFNFSWTFVGYILAAMQTYIWSYIIVGLWYLVGNCCKK